MGRRQVRSLRGSGGGWADLGQADIAIATPLGTAVGSLSTDGWFIGLVGTYEVRPGWSVLGRLGAFGAKVKISLDGAGSDSDSDTGVKFGLGLQYDVDKAVALRAEWARARLNAFDVNGDGDLWSLGLLYRF